MKNNYTLFALLSIALLLWACGPTYPEDLVPITYPQPQLDERVLSFNDVLDEMHCEVKVNYDSTFTTLSVFIESEGFEEDTFHLLMNDDGLLGDAIPNDGIYSRNTLMNRIDSLEGVLYANYKLYDNAELLVTQDDSLTIIANLAPSITEITMPDTIVRPTSGTKDLLIYLSVDDPNGIYDVVSAFFQVKSNSTGLWSSDFSMNDEGQSGDEVAGDGIFSSGLQISSTNSAATNYFRFRVKDTAANFSEWTLDSVVVR